MSHFLSSAQKINCQKMWVVYCKNKSFDKKLEIHIYYILIKCNLRFRGGCASFWLEGKERRGAVVHAATLIFLVFLLLQLEFSFSLNNAPLTFRWLYLFIDAKILICSWRHEYHILMSCYWAKLKSNISSFSYLCMF